MFDTISPGYQYLLIALAAFSGTLVFLWVINRIQARRQRAGDLADALSEWGLTRLAKPLREYSQGDYSEAIEGFVALAKEIRQPGGAIALLETAVKKCVEHYAATNATKCAELIGILQGGAAMKNVVP